MTNYERIKAMPRRKWRSFYIVIVRIALFLGKNVLDAPKCQVKKACTNGLIRR